jgi:hypothetical protein
MHLARQPAKANNLPGQVDSIENSNAYACTKPRAGGRSSMSERS